MTGATVVWFTGRSGAGKSTIADRVLLALSAQGKRVCVFDGDVVRAEINPHLGFTPEDIRANNRIVAGLCARSLDTCDYILVPIISPFAAARREARETLGARLRLVYCDLPLDAAIKRDTKGLYRKALDGQLDHFIGIDPAVPYEPPDDADLTIDTGAEDPATSAARVLTMLGYEEAYG